MDIFASIDTVRSELIIAAFVAFAVHCISSLYWRKKNFPPGPVGLPVLGYLPFLTRKPHLKLTELSKKYGEVFSITIGSKRILILNSAKTVREAFSKPEFSGRPELTIFHLLNVKNAFFDSGKLWSDQRRFTIHALKDLGFGKSIMHEHVLHEVQHLMELLKPNCGTPLNLLEDYLTPSISNNTCALLFGLHYEYDDPDRLKMNAALSEGGELMNQMALYTFLPWTSHLPFIKKIQRVDRLQEILVIIKDIFGRQIASHKNTLDETHPRDYIDKFLIEMKHQTEGIETTFNDDVLFGSLLQVFGAGSETLRSTMGWAMYTMAAYPEVERKIQQEIDEVIGREKTPVFNDQKDLPYTMSFLNEVQRYYTVLPINLLRRTLANTTVGGFDIPENTCVIANLHALHHSKEEWQNPEQFLPERFLSSDGKRIEKFDSYMPFSYGKRNCPGESLAWLELFLYFSTLMQSFNVSFPEGQTKNLDGILGITYVIEAHKLVLTLRDQQNLQVL